MFTLHLGEVLLSLIFILGGGSTLLVPGPRAAQIKRLLHIPLAEVAVRLNGLAMVVAGVFLAVGLWAQIVAWVLIALLIPTTIFGHAFWLESGPRRQEQLTQLLKNLGIMGGLLLVTLVAR